MKEVSRGISKPDKDTIRKKIYKPISLLGIDENFLNIN